MRGFFNLTCSLLLTISAAASPRALIGTAAPELEIEKLLQAPKGTSLDAKSLAGKVVVIDFWATWCGPCVGAIPRLNRTADAFASDPVVFISITDEDEAVVQRFLEKKPIRTWIALDPDRSVFDAFGVRGLPMTVVVGPDGKVGEVTDPYSLRDSLIRSLLP